MTTSGANSSHIKLDLNYPAFQKELFNLDANEIKKLFKTFAKLSKMSWDQLFTDHGLNWEEIKSQPGRFTVRVSLQYRAVVVRDAGFMRFQTLVTDHDRAYK